MPREIKLSAKFDECVMGISFDLDKKIESNRENEEKFINCLAELEQIVFDFMEKNGFTCVETGLKNHDENFRGFGLATPINEESLEETMNKLRQKRRK